MSDDFDITDILDGLGNLMFVARVANEFGAIEWVKDKISSYKDERNRIKVEGEKEEIYHKYKEKFGVGPSGTKPEPKAPDIEVRNWITSRNIAKAHRRSA